MSDENLIHIDAGKCPADVSVRGDHEHINTEDVYRIRMGELDIDADDPEPVYFEDWTAMATTHAPIKISSFVRDEDGELVLLSDGGPTIQCATLDPSRVRIHVPDDLPRRGSLCPYDLEAGTGKLRGKDARVTVNGMDYHSAGELSVDSITHLPTDIEHPVQVPRFDSECTATWHGEDAEVEPADHDVVTVSLPDYRDPPAIRVNGSVYEVRLTSFEVHSDQQDMTRFDTGRTRSEMTADYASFSVQGREPVRADLEQAVRNLDTVVVWSKCGCETIAVCGRVDAFEAGMSSAMPHGGALDVSLQVEDIYVME